MQPVLNLGKQLAQAARRYPGCIGLVHGENQWTWAELNENADAFAAGLQDMGVNRGDFVFVLTPNNRASYETIYSIAKIGAVYVPLNFRSTPNETVEFARLCKPVVLVIEEHSLDCAEAVVKEIPETRHIIVIGRVPAGRIDDGWLAYDDIINTHRGAVVPAVSVHHSDLWRLAFSAGSTGKPKAVKNTFGQIAFTIVNRLADVMIGVTPEHALLAIGPVSHGTGTAVVINTACAAKTVMLSTPKFIEEECWDLIEKHRITSLFLVPTMLMRLIRHPSAEGCDISSLRHVVYAGAPITRADQKVAIEKFGKALIQYYGSGESLGHGTVLRPEMHSIEDDNPATPAGTIGVPRTGTDMEVMDEKLQPVVEGEVGQICIRRGPGVFSGYYQDEENTAEALQGDWFCTGDLGKFDDRGFVYIVGRAKDMYKSGGLQVFPAETENYLAKHAAISEAYVVPITDSEWGEIGVAIVSLKAGELVSEEELGKYLRQYLAGYKQPKRIFIWDEIPKTAYGKVPKPMLREEIYNRGLAIEGEDIR